MVRKATFETTTATTTTTKMINVVVVTMTVTMTITMSMYGAEAKDNNNVYSPCEDAKAQKNDGFTIGIAFSNKESFYMNQSSQAPQLSPCDRRLDLPSKGAQLALFRPKVDELTLLTINRGDVNFDPGQAGGFMVAFAGQKYAARSPPIMFTDKTHTITTFTLILEFETGILQNLYWKSHGCDSCSGDNVCINKQDCGVLNSKCLKNGSANNACNIGIQLAFSGTDKNLDVFNSWYEVSKLRRYSLYGLYTDLKSSIVFPNLNPFT